MKIERSEINSLLSGTKPQSAQGAGDSFGALFNSMLDKVNTVQHNADMTINKFASGEIEDIHQVMIAIEEAHLALKLSIQIKNKIMESYQEIMRMQV